MDTYSASSGVSPFALSSPAYLYIGTHESAEQVTMDRLQKHFCSHHGCGVCTSCRAIGTKQHSAVMWLQPATSYTLEDLKPIFSTLSYALEPHTHFFFILQKAETLSATCANALLKSLEEPVPGYHFILVAHRAELLLPTLRSRCLIEYLHDATATPELALLLPFFTTTRFQDPAIFLKELDAANPNHLQSISFLDQLFIFWGNFYKKSILEKDTQKAAHSSMVVELLKKSLQQPPMPGSSKTFFKNLFLQIKQLP